MPNGKGNLSIIAGVWSDGDGYFKFHTLWVFIARSNWIHRRYSTQDLSILSRSLCHLSYHACLLFLLLFNLISLPVFSFQNILCLCLFYDLTTFMIISRFLLIVENNVCSLPIVNTFCPKPSPEEIPELIQKKFFYSGPLQAVFGHNNDSPGTAWAGLRCYKMPAQWAGQGK